MPAHDAHPSHPPAGPARFAGVGTVTVLLALHPLAAFVYLPALPLLRAHFGASAEAAQWTLSAFVFGFGATQLAWGWAADRHGRRRVLMAGLVAYLVAAIGCWAATDIAQIVAWRALQGAGAAAAGVCARAVLRDAYAPEASVRMLSIGFSWLSAVSIGAPLLGAALVSARGATASFEVLAMVGLALLAYVGFAMPETASAASAGRPLHDLRRIAGHRLFRAYTALTACTYAGHYLFLVGSAFLLMEREGLGAAHYGLVLSVGSLLHLAGTVACRRWLPRHGVRRTVAHAATLTLLAGGAGAAFALAGIEAPWALVLPQWLYVFAHAVHQSCGQAAVMAPFPRSAGTAAALSGTVLPVVAVGLASLLGDALGRSPVALPLGMGTCALATAIVAWTLVRRDGALPDEAAT